MTSIRGTVRDTTTVAADRDSAWAVVSDIARLGQHLPGLRAQRRTEHGWHYRLEGERHLGHTIQPSFTVAYELDAPDEVRFETPRATTDSDTRARGSLRLADDHDHRTRLSLHLELTLEAPVPSLLAGPARAILDRELDRLGAGFLDNLRHTIETSGPG